MPSAFFAVSVVDISAVFDVKAKSDARSVFTAIDDDDCIDDEDNGSELSSPFSTSDL